MEADGPAEIDLKGVRILPGYLVARGAAGARRGSAGRGGRRAVLPPGDALGQGDERADDLGRALRLGVGPRRLPLRGRATPRAWTGRRSRPGCWSSGTRSRGSTAPRLLPRQLLRRRRADGAAPGPGRGRFRLAGGLGLARRRRAVPRRRHSAVRPTASHWLKSGDVAVLEGPARLAFHGIDRVRAGSSTLLDKGGRINLTLRVVY
jgi:hypothetical protein